jgi:hypothetical protein
MKIQVTRFIFGDKATIGRLSVDGKFFCYTLEDKVRPPTEPKVFGETAIPYGTYPLTITYSPHFGRNLPLLGDVPNFSGVRIHPGNTPADTEGCILVGLEHTDNAIQESRDAFAALYELIEDTNRARDVISVEITQ